MPLQCQPGFIAPRQDSLASLIKPWFESRSSYIFFFYFSLNYIISHCHSFPAFSGCVIMINIWPTYISLAEYVELLCVYYCKASGIISMGIILCVVKITYMCISRPIVSWHFNSDYKLLGLHIQFHCVLCDTATQAFLSGDTAVQAMRGSSRQEVQKQL